ncbi:MAG: CDP-alcohol phosphatidyltransferase family protein [Candidatus Nanosalina sp.]
MNTPDLKEVKSLPNMITLSRILFAILAVYFISHLIRYLFFGLTILSDGVDGFVARRYGMETELGEILDPAVDKGVAALILISLFSLTGLKLFYIPLFFSREIFEALVAAVHFIRPLSEENIAKARFPGKIVTNLQFFTLVALLIPSTVATQILIWGVFMTSAWAVADYTNFLLKKQDLKLKPMRRKIYSYTFSGLAFGLVALYLSTELLSTIRKVPMF